MKLPRPSRPLLALAGIAALGGGAMALVWLATREGEPAAGPRAPNLRQADPARQAAALEAAPAPAWVPVTGFPATPPAAAAAPIQVTLPASPQAADPLADAQDDEQRADDAQADAIRLRQEKLERTMDRINRRTAARLAAEGKEPPPPPTPPPGPLRGSRWGPPQPTK